MNYYCKTWSGSLSDLLDALKYGLVEMKMDDNSIGVRKNTDVEDVPDWRWSMKEDKSSPIKRKLDFNDIMKDISQIIYNDPATIVTFKDGTKVCVKANKNDTFNKEVGLMYAIVKRLYANDFDGDGYLKSRGLGEKINDLIKRKSIDQKEILRARRAKRKAKLERQKLERQDKAKMANEVSEQAAKEACEQIYANDDDKKQ